MSWPPAVYPRPIEVAPSERTYIICERCGKPADGRYYFVAPDMPDEYHYFCYKCRQAWERGELGGHGYVSQCVGGCTPLKMLAGILTLDSPDGLCDLCYESGNWAPQVSLDDKPVDWGKFVGKRVEIRIV